jgi:hypothetical protein|tara:strand:- start:10605 stop:11075 length:471 start_codon:yes stop_codon:yes gene_type:complete
MSKSIRISFDFPDEKIIQKLYDAVNVGVDATVIETQARLLDMLSQPGTKSGKYYSRYRPSAPGRPPTVQSNMLRLSWTTGMRIGRKTVPGMVAAKLEQGTNFGSALKYAPILENPKKLNRPYIAPTIKKMIRDQVALNLVARSIKSAIPEINVLVN